MAAGNGHTEVLEKLWDFATELQQKPEKLKKQLYLSKDKLGHTALHMATDASHIEILEKLWGWAKELQLKPEELRN
jgi:ankyrin repeat protein